MGGVEIGRDGGCTSRGDRYQPCNLSTGSKSISLRIHPDRLAILQPGNQRLTFAYRDHYLRGKVNFDTGGGDIRERRQNIVFDLRRIKEGCGLVRYSLYIGNLLDTHAAIPEDARISHDKRIH